MINVGRSLLFYLGYFTAMLLIGVLFLPIAPFLPLAARYRLLNLYNYFLMVWFRIACGVRYEIQGRENIPSGPCVIQANHQCEWETLFLQVMKTSKTKLGENHPATLSSFETLFEWETGNG